MFKDKIRSFFKSNKEEPITEKNIQNEPIDDFKINLSINIDEDIVAKDLESNDDEVINIIEENLVSNDEEIINVENEINKSEEREIAMASFKPFADNLTCDSQKELEIVYLRVRKHTLNNIGIGDSSNPYDLTGILTNVSVFVNKVDIDFVRLNNVITQKEISIPSPCNNAPQGEMVTAFVDIEECKVVAAGRYAPVLYSGSIGLLDGHQEFVGLDQTLDFYLPGDKMYDENDFVVTVTMKDGDIGVGGSGFIGVEFRADDPINDPNGHGEYFFKVKGSARIDLK